MFISAVQSQLPRKQLKKKLDWESSLKVRFSQGFLPQERYGQKICPGIKQFKTDFRVYFAVPGVSISMKKYLPEPVLLPSLLGCGSSPFPGSQIAIILVLLGIPVWGSMLSINFLGFTLYFLDCSIWPQAIKSVLCLTARLLAWSDILLWRVQQKFENRAVKTWVLYFLTMWWEIWVDNDHVEPISRQTQTPS